MTGIEQLDNSQIDLLEAQQGENVCVIAVSGHGSNYRFDSESFPEPAAWGTAVQVEKAAANWESYACTIGGKGTVIDMIKVLREYREDPGQFDSLPFIREMTLSKIRFTKPRSED